MHPCRVAIIDSGINARHPHVGNVVGGFKVRLGGESDDLMDRLGHGTAVAGAIHEKAPTAEILVIKVFERSLAASIEQLVDGIEWALDHNADIINLSLGTSNPKHRERLEAVVSRALRQRASIVSAREIAGGPSFPGCMQGVVGVTADAGVPREQVQFCDGYAVASPYPRPIPGMPPERNLCGVSFAVANVSGFLCAEIIRAAATLGPLLR